MSVSFDPKFIKFGKVASASSLLTGLSAYWTMDDSSGPVLDSTANDKDLTADDTPVFSGAGKIGTCVSFNSDYDCLYRADCTGLAPSADVWSCSIWVKYTVIPSVGGYSYGLIRMADSAASTYSIRIACDSANVIHFVAYDTGNTINEWMTTGEVIADNTTWHHVVFILKGTGLEAEIWVDGVECETTDGVQSGSVNTPDGVFIIGSNAVAGDEVFNGSVDEVGIWNKALTSTEVASLYNAGSGRTYPFS